MSGRSAYDAVFATPIKLRALSFSSQFDDYREISGSSGASLGSSIPILELPELNERKTVDDVRRLKLDYSMVFGEFGNLDAAVPFEELIVKPKEKSRFTNGASARNRGRRDGESWLHLHSSEAAHHGNRAACGGQTGKGMLAGDHATAAVGAKRHWSVQHGDGCHRDDGETDNPSLCLLPPFSDSTDGKAKCCVYCSLELL